MKPNIRKNRSFSLLEVLTAVSLMGAFFLIAAPLTTRLIHATQYRAKTQDQILFVSSISDHIRANLQSAPGKDLWDVVTVEPHRLQLRRGDRTLSYQIDGSTIQCVKSHLVKSQPSAAWKVPYATLTFSQQPGKNNAVLVGLHWQINRPVEPGKLGKKVAIDMFYAVQQAAPKEMNP